MFKYSLHYMEVRYQPHAPVALPTEKCPVSTDNYRNTSLVLVAQCSTPLPQKSKQDIIQSSFNLIYIVSYLLYVRKQNSRINVIYLYSFHSTIYLGHSDHHHVSYITSNSKFRLLFPYIDQGSEFFLQFLGGKVVFHLQY
jgi:hypothetical protein